MDMELPFSQACENNKLPILEVLKSHLGNSSNLLEVGGGTGQHAVYFAEAFPHLNWHSSDIPSNVDLLSLRIIQAKLANLPAPFPLDVNARPWNCDTYDAVFTANSLHIMPASSVEQFFGEVAVHLTPNAKLFVYGPFKYGGEFTTPSNANFDLWLKDRDPQSGVRDFEWVDSLASSVGLKLIEDNSMPANNQLLVWEKSESQ